MKTATALLVIGIHREELAFGRVVAQSLSQDEVAVLTIPEGISGERPLASQQFRYETLHRTLYLQLLPHVQGRHEVLIDLHTGFDPHGPSADLICADLLLRQRLETAVRGNARLAAQDIRVIPLGAETALPHAHTVIPRQIWENPAFAYVGLEIYLPEDGAGREAAESLALELVHLIVSCHVPDNRRTAASAQQGTAMYAQMNPQAGNENAPGDRMPALLPAGRKRE